ncbi:MAG: DUF4321 domain-containing protein [Thermoanaerobacteraceae bacterium]
MKRNKSPWTLVFLIVAGLILGGFTGDLLANFFKQLAYQQIIGMNSPVSLDLNFIRFSFMLSFKINIGAVLGLIIAIYAYYKM